MPNSPAKARNAKMAKSATVIIKLSIALCEVNTVPFLNIRIYQIVFLCYKDISTMKKTIDTEETRKRSFLVGIRDEKMPVSEADSLLKELSRLADTLGLEILSTETVHLRGYNAKFGMGTGKAEEIAQKAASLEADCIVFDREISPSQQRNWESLAGIPVIDRQELIIQIFASRARTREAELQARLAGLIYSLPRLQHKHIDLSRQRGGRYGARDTGETRLETDRRQVEVKIHRLEEELEQLTRQRQVQRKKRERSGIPVCALVGYTNAGKSSILNALTGAGVYAEDKLFATVDSTSRRLRLPQGTEVLLVDTVGFIRRLPHSLIKAFRSTLEEARRGDLILNVLDASDGDAEVQYGTTISVLNELKAGEIPMITVLNKIDKVESLSNLRSADLLNRYPGSVAVSALKGSGLPELCARIESSLAARESTGKKELN
jgi:GTP-binding protein HflX